MLSLVPFYLGTTSLLLILVFFIGILVEQTNARFCYSCAGTCHSASCNCQMGSCESDYCFMEKKPTEIGGVFRITKGCVKRPTRRTGCDYDHFPDHIQCTCKGDFCNDAILMRHHPMRRNVTCRSCPETRPDCSSTCQGQWCHEKVSTGATGCGFGPPSLPYFYQTPELFYYRSKVCLTMSRGNGSPHKYCICNTHLCNDPVEQNFDGSSVNPFAAYLGQLIGRGSQQQQQHQRSLSNPTYYRDTPRQQKQQQEEFYECVNCDVTAVTAEHTSACRQNKCVGHFCTFATKRIFGGNGLTSTRMVTNGGHQAPAAIIHQKQGCINVTDKSHVQLGCNHKWMDEAEELYCACRGDLCNTDLATASTSGVEHFGRMISKTMFSALLVFSIYFFIF